jgi:hypothetical protein
MLLVNCPGIAPRSIAHSYSSRTPMHFPKELVTMLRRAFIDTTKDAEFFGEMTKARLDVDPVAGQEVERIINDAFKLDAALLGKLKDIFYK